MTRKSIARFAGIAAGAALLVGFAAPVGAVTIAELQAQIAALMAQLQAMSGGSSASAAITSDLTVGSSGSQVVALQNTLIAGGYLTIPAGVAQGYFGALTKAAVMHWQAAVGLPSTGFVGPLSRAKLAGTVTGGTTTGGTTTGGTTGSTSTGSITTPGAEGTITVDNSPISNSTVYEGDMMKQILAFKVKATGSDLAVQRVKVNLGSSTTFYNKVAQKAYLTDESGNVLASADLNSSTVVKDNGTYFLTLSGFSSVVAKDSSRIYFVKADFRNSISDTGSYTVQLADNGVRAIDGAGIDLYAPATGSTVTKSITVSASLSDSANLTVSTDSTTPLAKEIVTTSGANKDEADKVVLLTFDIKADKDSILVTDLKNFVITNTSASGVGATASTSYLYKGNGTGGQLLATAAVTLSNADFTDIDHTIPAGTTQTYTLAVDVRAATNNAAVVAASFTGNTTNVVAENSVGDTITTVTGSATGNNVTVRKIGPVFSLVGTPTMTRQAVSSNDTTGNATSTGIATFTVHITAVGGDITFGSTASTTLVFGGTTTSNSTATTSATWLSVYKNGASNGALSSNTAAGTSAIISYAIPSSGVTTSGQNFTLSDGNSIDLPVTVQFTVSAGSTNSYAVQINGFRWYNSTVGFANTTAMTDKAEWRTPAVSLP